MRDDGEYWFDKTVIWFVVFHDKLDWWFPGRFGHVSLAGFCNGTWVHLDVRNSGASCIPIFQFDEVNAFLETLLANYTVVKFGPPARERRHFLAPMTCVSFVKHLLGVRSRALRPDGLFRTLIRNYGCEVWNAAEDHDTPGNPGAEAATGAG